MTAAVILPRKCSEEMERVWREAFFAQLRRRRHRPFERSAEAAAYEAIVASYGRPVVHGTVIEADSVILPEEFDDTFERAWQRVFYEHSRRRLSSRHRARDARSAVQAAWEAIVAVKQTRQ